MIDARPRDHDDGMKVDAAILDEACGVLSAGGVPMLAVLELHERLESGAARAVFSRTEEGQAVMVVDDRGSWRQVVAAGGPESALLAGLHELRGTSEALVWDEDCVKIAPATLDELGFRLLLRQVFTQELSRVPLDQPEPAGLEVSLLGDTSLAESRALFARTHAGSVEGLYATLPHAPTDAQCGLAFDGYLSGALGVPVPSACVVIRHEGRVGGVICCAASEEKDTGTLLGLAVDPTVRGKGLSRVLVRRAQKALHAAGFAKMLFLTTDRNAPVHRLFTLEEIVKTETFPTRLWLRSR
ncbi:MAG: GNAT family N-acetyltransferase [Archangium sp.]|nr:GNAT family N-acetyltransferase [Archangium sp.]MDP3151758.1 GNAT family N-acetyltransferase [Archangium sp.]MDP3573276.1 GNAT family N-acetyltransferase [Archangium sp.]